jgi:hypothetical protein
VRSADPTQTGREFAEWHLDGVRTDEYGGIPERGAARFDRLATSGTLCVSEDCDDDDVVALERWREIGRGCRYAQPGAIRGCRWRWHGANLLLCTWINYMIWNS